MGGELVSTSLEREPLDLGRLGLSASLAEEFFRRREPDLLLPPSSPSSALRSFRRLVLSDPRSFLTASLDVDFEERDFVFFCFSNAPAFSSAVMGSLSSSDISRAIRGLCKRGGSKNKHFLHNLPCLVVDGNGMITVWMLCFGDFLT